MLLGHIATYGLSSVLPGLISFVFIYVFTRLVPPDVYGMYSLVVSVSMLVQMGFFYWVQVGTTRFIPGAAKAGTVDALLGSVHRAFGMMAGLVTALCVGVLALAPAARETKIAFAIGLAVLLARSLAAITQAVDRGLLRPVRYNVVAIAQSILGFALTLLFVAALGWTRFGMLFGLAGGCLASALPGLWDIAREVRERRAGGELKQLLGYGAPLAVYSLMCYVLSSSDRILIAHYLGSGPVGLYSVAYAAVDRTMATINIMIAMGAFPLVVQRYEREGEAAARSQLARNATVLLALAVPACAGLLLGSDRIAALLFGEQYRRGAQEIMPWIVVASFMAGLQIHYFDHAFLLAKRTVMCLWSGGAAVVANVVINVVLLPRIGLMAAVYSTVISYALALAGSIAVGRFVFRVPFPFGQAARIAAATAVMALVLWRVRLPMTVVGLVLFVALGLASYAAAALAMDVAGARLMVVRRLSRPGVGRA